MARQEKNMDSKKKLLEERVVSISRVTKVTKGGRHFRFAATMAVGDGKGLVGIGTGKANEVPEAIKKGIQAANKNLSKVSIVDNRTIPHDAIGVCGKARVLIKPAKEGTGVIAGGSVRPVLELAGYRDIKTKVIGTNNPRNVVYATIEALKNMSTIQEVAKKRGKKVSEIL